MIVVSNDIRAVDADSVRWARRSLRIDDVDQALSAGDLLRRLTEWEYVVPPEAVDAVQLLANPEGLGARSSVAEVATESGRAQRLEAAVTEFANSFFDLTQDRREQRWQTLMDECQGIPALIQWLNNLAPGLNVVLFPSSTDERFNELVNACREVFVLRYPANVRRRQEFFAMCREDRVLWEMAARKLQSEHLLFVGRIAMWVTRLASLRSSDRDQHERFQQFILQSAREQPAESRQHSGSQRVPWWLIGVVMAALLRLFVAVNQPTSPTSQPPRFNRPKVIPSDHRPPTQPTPLVEGMRPETVENLLRENPELLKTVIKAKEAAHSQEKRPQLPIPTR